MVFNELSQKTKARCFLIAVFLIHNHVIGQDKKKQLPKDTARVELNTPIVQSSSSGSPVTIPDFMITPPTPSAAQTNCNTTAKNYSMTIICTGTITEQGFMTRCWVGGILLTRKQK